MRESGCHSAAWIRGFFIVFLIFLSACSDDEKQSATQQANTFSQNSSVNIIQRSEPKLQRPPFSQLILDKISIDYPYTPTRDFKDFIKKIRGYAQRKNIRALQNSLSPLFHCQGLSCKEGAPIAEQFETIITSLEKQPWKQLVKIIDTKYYQQINGGICGPANFIFNGDGQDKTTTKGWGYINGKSVRLRKKASIRAPIVTHISHNAVRQLSPINRAKKGMTWVEVETLKGQKGFVAEKYFLPLKSKQMCYQQMLGEWKISGFRDAIN